MVLRLDKLQWCTDSRRNDTEFHARSSDLRLQEGVGNVCAVPRQENIDAIDRSYTYVQTVKCSLLGQTMAEFSAAASASASSGLARTGRSARNHLSLGGGGRITGCTLRNDNFRNEKSAFATARLPPFSCHLLISGNYQVATRTRRQIADYAGFEVNALHLT